MAAGPPHADESLVHREAASLTRRSLHGVRGHLPMLQRDHHDWQDLVQPTRVAAPAARNSPVTLTRQRPTRPEMGVPIESAWARSLSFELSDCTDWRHPWVEMVCCHAAHNSVKTSGCAKSGRPGLPLLFSDIIECE